MSAESMKKSSIVVKDGSLPQHSEPGAVAVLTPIDMQSSDGFQATPETIKALVAITTALLAEMLSGDLICLAMCQAEKMAIESGVSPEEFNRVKKHLVKFWAKKKAQNPIGSMF